MHRPGIVVTVGLLLALCGLDAARAQEVGQGRIDCGLGRERVIRNEGETHAWTLRARAGDVVNVSVVGELAEFQPRWRLRGPDGAVVGDGWARDDLRRIPISATYTLELADPEGGGTGRYFVQVQWVGERACGARLGCGALQRERLVLPGEHRVHLFTGRAGEVLNIAVAGLDDGLVPVWTLFGPDGQFVDAVRQTDQIRKLPRDGTYTLMIEDANLVNVGAYSLSLQGIAERSTCGAGLTCGRTLIGELTEPAQHDAYVFPARDGERIHVVAEPVDPSDGFDPDWTLAGPGGRPVSRTSGDPGIVEIQEPGLHTVVVSDHRGPGIGRYHVSIRSLSGNAGCGLALVDDAWEAVSLDLAGEFRAFTFSGEEGERVDIAVEHVGESGFRPVWTLFGPKGEALSLDEANGLRRVAVRRTGIYTLLVGLAGTTPVGELRVRLSRVEEPPQE